MQQNQPITRSIAVIDPAKRVAEVECFNRMVLSRSFPMTYHLPCLYEAKSYEHLNPEELAGVVIFGSGASVYDEFGWQKELVKWLESVVFRNSIPLLAICYGHQLVAHLMGGKVEFISDGIKRTGFRDVQVTSKNRFGLREKPHSIVVSHCEIVTDCSRSMECIGRSGEFDFEVLSHKTLPILTFQGHPEAGEAFMKNQSIFFDKAKDDFSQGHILVDQFVDFCKLQFTT